MKKVAEVFKEKTGKDYQTAVVWKMTTKKKLTKTVHTYYNWLNACDWCGFCDIRFYLQQNKITKILNEKSRRKIFVRVENSVYITWHRHRIIFSFLYFFLRLIVVWGPPTETAYKKTVGLAAVLLCASNRGRSQTAVLKLIISRPPLFYTHGGKGGTPCFFALSMPLICQKKPRHRTRIF